MTAFQRSTQAPVVRPALDSSDPQLLRGSVLVEVIAPTEALPELPGWTLRVWPLARLGDLTLEATPCWPQGLDVLLAGLRSLGFTPLGHRTRA